MDIAQAMAMLQGMQGGGGMNPMAAANPLGALQPGMSPDIAPPMTAPVAPPDYNAILQQHLVNQQAEQAAQGRLGAAGLGNAYGFGGGMGNNFQDVMGQMMAERLGARTGGAMQFDPSMGMGGMHQQFRDWRQAGNQPVRAPMGFGARPPGGMGGAPGMTQPAGVATLPGPAAAAPIQSGLGADYMKQRGRLGGPGGGERYNPDVNQF